MCWVFSFCLSASLKVYWIVVVPPPQPPFLYPTWCGLGNFDAFSNVSCPSLSLANGLLLSDTLKPLYSLPSLSLPILFLLPILLNKFVSQGANNNTSLLISYYYPFSLLFIYFFLNIIGIDHITLVVICHCALLGWFLIALVVVFCF